jgi:hypothetical protein
MLLVTHGGFGFHTPEVYQRFGPETTAFFFKVSATDFSLHVQTCPGPELMG